MRLGEFFIALGFDVDDKKLKEFNDGLKDGLKDMLKLSAVAAGAVYAINSFVSGSVAAATAMRNFNAETGNSIDALQKWQVGSVLTNASITADQVTASFHAMATAISDVTMGKGPSGTFAMLGISDVRGRDVGDVMEELRQNFDKNVKTWGLLQTVNMMKEVGFDPGMLNALKMTRKEFDELVNGKILDPETRQRLVDLGDAIAKFKFEFKFFKDQMSAEWSPRLIDVLEDAIPVFTDFWNSVSAVGKALVDLWKTFDPTWQQSMIGLSVMLLAYFNPVTAMFVALAAAIWDIGRALRGLESYTGKSILWLLNLMDSEDGSKIANWKKALEEAGQGTAQNIKPRGSINQKPEDMGYTPVPQDFVQRGDLMRFYEGTLNPTNQNDRMVERMMQQHQTTMNNVWNIQSDADAVTIADILAEHQRRMLNNAQAESNNGVRY